MTGSNVTTPREWFLLRPESRTAILILDAIDPEGNARDQAIRIFEIYRDYSQSEAARAVGIGEANDTTVREAKRLLRSAVTSALLNLADFDRVLDSARQSLMRLTASEVPA